MKDQQHTQITPIRTFAKDLEYERRKRGDTSPVVVPTPPTTTPPPKIEIPAPPIAAVHETPITEKPKYVPQPNPSDDRINQINLNDDIADDIISAAVKATREDQVKRENRATPTVIPPYHALKQMATEQTPDEKIIITDDESAATIITDKKHNRFNPFRNVRTAIARWWSARAEKRLEKKEATFVVPETSRRKSVIQKATTHTALDAIGDPAQFRKQVRLRNESTADNTQPVTPPEIPPIPTPPPTAPVPSIQNVQVVARTNSVPTPTPAPTPRETPPAPAPLPAARSFEDEIVTIEAPAVVSPTPVTKRSVATSDDHEGVSPKRARLFISTNALASIALVCIVVTATIIFGRPYLNQFLTPATEPLPVVNNGILIQAPATVIGLTPQSKEELFSALTTNKATSSPVQEITFSDQGTTLTPESLLKLLDPTLDTTLTRSVSVLVFGWVDTTTPFIILRITDRTTVLGSLLKWETNMPDALAPLFPKTTQTGTRVIDRTITESDVRIFTNTAGAESIVYGFSNSQTVIITTNTSAFLTLSELVTQPK